MKKLSQDIHFLKCKAKINTSLILISTIKSKRRTTTTTTIRPTTPKTTTPKTSTTTTRPPVTPIPEPDNPISVNPVAPVSLRDFLARLRSQAPATPAQAPILRQETIQTTPKTTTPKTTTPKTTTLRTTTTRRTNPRTTTQTTTTSTTRPTAKLAEEVEDNLVLDFSSGEPEMVENTATQVEVKSEEEVADSPAAKNAFSKFRGLIDIVGIAEELEEAGNVTIFSPLNKAFDKLDTPVEDLPLPTIRKFILKHFVKDFLFKRDMVNGPVSITFNLSFRY